MYTVYLDGQYLLFSTSVSGLQISDCKLTEELGKAGSFEFTIYPDHPQAEYFTEMLSVVYQGSDMIFRGRVLNVNRGIENERKIYCEGDLSYLFDSLITPHSYSGTYSGYFSFLINQHNLHVESSKTFSMGFFIPDNIIPYDVYETEYKTAWELINSHFCINGAYLRVNHSGDGMQLDLYNETVYNNALQEIRFGVNLLDINIASKNEDLYTCIVPLGAKPEGSDLRLTISSVNNYIDYLVNTTLANRYGKIYKKVIWDDITVASTLYTIATDYVNNMSTEAPYTAEITAVDLSYIDGSGNSFNVMDIVDVYSSVHFTTNPQQFMVKKIEIDLTNPADNKIYAGIIRKGITDMIDSGSGSSTVIYQESDQPFLIDTGISGIWHWSKYSDGSAECFGKINVSGQSTGSSIGSWYRTAAIYAETDYPYPITFSEAPATEIQFHTRNEKGALVWTFSTSADVQKNYVPQCYLIRPTQADNINGNINIIAKGKYDAN